MLAAAGGQGWARQAARKAKWRGRLCFPKCTWILDSLTTAKISHLRNQKRLLYSTACKVVCRPEHTSIEPEHANHICPELSQQLQQWCHLSPTADSGLQIRAGCPAPAPSVEKGEPARLHLHPPGLGSLQAECLVHMAAPAHQPTPPNQGRLLSATSADTSRPSLPAIHSCADAGAGTGPAPARLAPTREKAPSPHSLDQFLHAQLYAPHPAAAQPASLPQLHHHCRQGAREPCFMPALSLGSALDPIGSMNTCERAGQAHECRAPPLG